MPRALVPLLFASLLAGCGAPALPGLGGADDDAFPVDAASTDGAFATSNPGDDSAIFEGPDSAVGSNDSAIAPGDSGVVSSDAGIVSTDSGSASDAASDGGVDAPSDADGGVVGPIVSVTCDKVDCSGSSPICCGSWQVIDYSWSCASSCTLGRAYNCDDASDCPTGQLCCTSTDLFGTIDGSSCQADCGGDTQLCDKKKECASGECNPFTPPDAPYTVGACK